MLATRTLEEEWWEGWDARYTEASSSLDGREQRMAELELEVERELTLLGCTAIEDKLQEGVPAAIHTLLAAGIKVAALIFWVTDKHVIEMPILKINLKNKFCPPHLGRKS